MSARKPDPELTRLKRANELLKEEVAWFKQISESDQKMKHLAMRFSDYWQKIAQERGNSPPPPLLN